ALPDGRPFLAMKLTQGRTLAELLEKQGPDAARWLGVFEAVCQAVGYAHSEGVIHRDLKPDNVMVGEFGEVQVMDWGLAQFLSDRSATGDPEAITGAAILSVHADGGWQTHFGTVLGTPAFMPPEQARGQVSEVDRRSDVFGLGAILCALLT